MSDQLRAALEAMREFAEHDDECIFATDLSGVNGDDRARHPARCNCGFDGALALYEAATREGAGAGLDELPTFEVAQVVGDLQPGRRRHDWCSVHGDIGPSESIDAHARRHHGSGSEAIRKARKVLHRARLAAAHLPAAEGSEE